MWELDINLLGELELAKYIDTIIPHVGEFIYIDGEIYEVKSVSYDYHIKSASIIVKKCIS